MGTIKKRYKKKEKDPIYKTKLFWIGSLLFLSIIALFLIFLYSPFYQLESIEVTGTDLTAEDALKTMIERRVKVGVEPLESKSLIFFSGLYVSREVASELPHVESLQIKKIFPDKLSVKVKERKADLVWCVTENNCFEVDITGVAFKGATDKKEKIEVIDDTKTNLELGEKAFSENRIEEIIAVKNELKDDFDFETKKIIIPENRSFFVEVNKGFQLRFNFKGDLEKQLKRLELLLEKEIDDIEDLEYIELRYGNQIYYK